MKIRVKTVAERDIVAAALEGVIQVSVFGKDKCGADVQFEQWHTGGMLDYHEFVKFQRFTEALQRHSIVTILYSAINKQNERIQATSSLPREKLLSIIKGRFEHGYITVCS